MIKTCIWANCETPANVEHPVCRVHWSRLPMGMRIMLSKPPERVDAQYRARAIATIIAVSTAQARQKADTP